MTHKTADILVCFNGTCGIAVGYSAAVIVELTCKDAGIVF